MLSKSQKEYLKKVNWHEQKQKKGIKPLRLSSWNERKFDISP